MNLFIAISACSTLLIIWFSSDFFEYYFSWTGNLFKIKEYNEALRQQYNDMEIAGKSPDFANYLEFIQRKYGHTFLGKLITCPLCMAFWFDVLICFVAGFEYLFPIYLFGLIGYFYVSVLMRKGH